MRSRAKHLGTVGLMPCVVIVAAACGPLSSANADEDKELRARWAKVYGEIADALRIYPSDDDAKDFVLVSQPILSYSNPIRTRKQHGSVYLWTVENRPAAIGSIWSVTDRQDETRRKIAFEFHSLSSSAVAADRGDETVWESVQPGLEWSVCPSKTLPATNRPLRLAQMRRLVRGVSAKIDQDDGKLRLMPQPLYRYPDSTGDVVDGAVFGFVMGTDPELFAIIEARTGEEGTAWHWAFARFTHVGVAAKLADQVVFECRHRRETAGLTKYFVKFGVEVRPASLEETTD